MAEDKVGFNDPIHGYMEFDPLLVKIIHTPCFQRMKDIKQLGGSYWIFPGASHNRFEHSLGTAHLAGMMIERLRDTDDGGKYVTDEDILCVKIAALCHDLGHGPFSHVFDRTMKEKLIKYHKSEIDKLSGQNTDYHKNHADSLVGWKHEHASCKMFDYMIESPTGLKKAFEERNLGENERKLIKEIIKGKKKVAEDDEEKMQVSGDGEQKVPVVKRNGKEKWFLFEIVANKVNAIDCDKFDYFARDCHNLGMKSNFDHLRYIHNMRILTKPDTNELHLCVRDKLAFDIYELFHTRWSLHHRAYKHKTTIAIEEMITDAFVLLEEKYKFSEAIFDMEKYAMLTDSIFYEILRSSEEKSNEKTKEAQAILKRVQERKLYKLYAEFPHHEELKDDDLKGAAEEIAKHFNPEVKAKDLFVTVVTINFGKKEKNPVESVIFYKKKKKQVEDQESLEKAGEKKFEWEICQISKEKVSKMLPAVFTEQYVRIYEKNPKQDIKGREEEKKYVKAALESYIEGKIRGKVEKKKSSNFQD